MRALPLAALLLVAAAARADPALPPLAAGETWFDDWYAVERIDEHTFAIAEPRYDQHNLEYLIVGSDRALLFDSGPGVRDIRRVVASLTKRPVIAAFSHLHFDHVGGLAQFASVGSLDLPSIRARADAQGRFMPSLLQHAALGRPRWRISEWWPPGGAIDLGGRTLRAISVPGHTPESLALYDAERGQLFSGDFLYPGDLYAFGPGSDLAAYRDSARRVLALTRGQDALAIYGAHVPSSDTLPRQGREDLVRAQQALGALLAGQAGPWRLVWVLHVPVRRYTFGHGLAILAPLF